MLSNIQTKVQAFLSENASALLTAGGVVGTVATAVLTGRAAVKAHAVIETAEQHKREVEKTDAIKADRAFNPEVKLTKLETVKVSAVCFIPPVLSGTATIGSIVLANRLSAQKAAALAAAYGISQKQRDEYKAKIEEKLGLKKATDIQDETQQDRINKSPPQAIFIGPGPVLCYDAFSDRYFRSTAEHIRKAEKVVQSTIENHNECPLRTFYDELELPQTQFDDILGWNIEHPCNIVISAMMMNDDACLCIDFNNLPIHDFALDY